MSDEKIKGVWWRADAPDKKLQGEITYSPTSGATVDIFGHIYEEFDDKTQTKRFTLHGLTLRNKAVSLFDCAVANSRIHIPGGRSCIIKSVFGVVGAHFHEPSEIRFKKVFVNYNGLRDWTWTSGIQTTYEEKPRRAIFTYQVPDDAEVGQFGDLSGKLSYSSTTSLGGATLSIKEDCQLIIDAVGLTTYAPFENLFHTFQHFLSLALQRPVYAVQIIGRIDVPREVIEGHELYEEFLIIRKLSIKDWDREELIPDDLLFTLPELGAPLRKVFGTFFSQHERLKPSLDLYLSTVYNPEQSSRVEFLTLAQGLEGYHRVSMAGKYIDDAAYQSGLQQILTAAIPAEIDPGFRTSLRNKLKYLHEFSLRKRIEGLAQRHASIVGNLLGSPRDFGSLVSELRNQLTHPDSSSGSGVIDYKRLWHLSEKMALLLEVCFLDDLGFQHDRIRQIVNSRSQRARRIHFASF